LLDRKRRTKLHDAAFADQARQTPSRIGAPTEPEDENLVALIEVLDKPSVGFDDLVVDAVARDASAGDFTALCTDALAVVDPLVGGLRRQRLQPPHVRVVVERVERAI
jgi:hypothetical protein